MYALLGLAAAVYSIDKPYEYKVPEEYQKSLKPGMRVLAPFGNGNRVSEAIVLSVQENCVYPECKSIIRPLDSAPLITQEQLQLAYFMRERYFCTVFQAIRCMLPAGVWINKSGLSRSRDRFCEMVRLCMSADDVRQIIDQRKATAPKQAEILDLLSSFDALPVKDLLHYTGASRASLKRLSDLQLVELYSVEAYRRPIHDEIEPAALPVLSEEQERVVSEILLNCCSGSSGSSVHLLSGVTGSGKTSIYAHLIDKCLKNQKTALLLLPEIALTPQMLTRFSNWFGERVAVLHSGLSLGERYDEWKRIQRSEAQLVLGTRSAVFAPVSNLGLIIMDEEQEDSYRSDSSPRYHAREVARFRCHRAGADLILGSATPDIRSRYLAEQGVYSFHLLQHRYNQKPLPLVHITDMKDELRAGNRSLLSRPLKEALIHRLENDEQSILFLNRRGTNKLVFCSECGFTYRCPHCSVSMTWHAKRNRLICHYCGFWKTLDSSCPNCSGRLSYVGAGTQLAEAELMETFPGVRVLRVDSDTVSPMGSHRALFQKFRDERIPIMVGTQMIAKGLDFDNVTLVGVLSADQSLYSNDFRAGERTFSLITQVVGRSGRGAKKGEAFIQTFTPENEIIRIAARQDYESFYHRELKMRRLQNAPPFFDWISLSATGKDEARVLSSLQRCKAMLTDSFCGDDQVQVLGPVPMSVVKLNDRFRYRLLLVCNVNSKVRQVLSSLLIFCAKQKDMSHVNFYVENEPSL